MDTADRTLVNHFLDEGVKQTRLFSEVMRKVSSSAARPVPVNTSMWCPVIPLPMSVARKVLFDHGVGKVEICTCAPDGINERSIAMMPSLSTLPLASSAPESERCQAPL